MKSKYIGSSVTSLITIGVAVSMATGCAPKAQDKEEVTAKNVLQAGDPNIIKTIGDSETQYTIIGKGALKSQLLTGEVEAGDSVKASKSLIGTLAKSYLKFTRNA